METVMNPLMNINELYFDYKGMEKISQYLPLFNKAPLARPICICTMVYEL